MDRMVGIVEIPEGDGTGGTGLGAGGLIGIFFDFFLPVQMRLVFCRLVPMKTEAAFFNHPPHSGGYDWIQVFFHAFRPDRIIPVEIPGMIGAGTHAVPASETPGVNLADDSGLIVVVGCRCRADRYAGRMSVRPFTVLTGSGQIADIRFRIRLAVGQFIHAHPCNAFELVGFVFPEGHIIFCHAGDHTGAAPGAQIQINDHSKF